LIEVRKKFGIELTRSVSITRFGSEFDDFLFAPIGEERNGMLLSVLSALARLGVDPWLGAANLTRMPKETATARMVSSITATKATDVLATPSANHMTRLARP
jgi:hypothetical protein